MKKQFILVFAGILASAASFTAYGQDEIHTVFKEGGPKRVTAYGAAINRFTSIDGQFANVVGAYGGIYINRRILLGIGGAASTNDIPVPEQLSTIGEPQLSYQFVQFGFMTEVVAGSNRVIHPVFQFFTGPGLTFQYDRRGWEDEVDHHNYDEDHTYDQNWFMIAEPGVQLEINVVKWMRFSPGFSYRFAYGSDSAGLSDSRLSGPCVNLTMKFGRF